MLLRISRHHLATVPHARNEGRPWVQSLVALGNARDEGKKGEHAPQKAMDSAVPAGSGGSGCASDGASPGAGGSTYNAQDANKASDKQDDKQKLPPENLNTQTK